jgi:hypothetical protein
MFSLRTKLAASSFFIATATLALPLPAYSNIASPNNAGQNAGNNAGASGNSFLSTARFGEEPLIDCSGYGLGGFQGCSQNAFNDLTRILQNLVGESASASTRSLVLQVLASPNTVSLSSPEAFGRGSLARVLDNECSLRFNPNDVNDEGYPIASLSAEGQQRSLCLFSLQASQAGLDTVSIQLGSELVTAGVQVAPAFQLVASLQGLATKPSFDALGTSISAFNVIVASSPDIVLSRLESKLDFVQLSAALRTVRNAVVTK